MGSKLWQGRRISDPLAGGGKSPVAANLAALRHASESTRGRKPEDRFPGCALGSSTPSQGHGARCFALPPSDLPCTPTDAAELRYFRRWSFRGVIPGHFIILSYVPYPNTFRFSAVGVFIFEVEELDEDNEDVEVQYLRQSWDGSPRRCWFFQHPLFWRILRSSSLCGDGSVAGFHMFYDIAFHTGLPKGCSDGFIHTTVSQMH